MFKTTTSSFWVSYRLQTPTESECKRCCLRLPASARVCPLLTVYLSALCQRPCAHILPGRLTSDTWKRAVRLGCGEGGREGGREGDHTKQLRALERTLGCGSRGADFGAPHPSLYGKQPGLQIRVVRVVLGLLLRRLHRGCDGQRCLRACTELLSAREHIRIYICPAWGCSGLWCGARVWPPTEAKMRNHSTLQSGRGIRASSPSAHIYYPQLCTPQAKGGSLGGNGAAVG